MEENKQINILLLQETLPEEAAGHNPLLPTAPQQEETSPTSKVIFFHKSQTQSSSLPPRDVNVPNVPT